MDPQTKHHLVVAREYYLAGEYDNGGVPVTIAVREDNVLQYIVLGSVRELEPVRPETSRRRVAVRNRDELAAASLA